MFEVGKSYNIITVEDGGESSSIWKLVEIEGTLIKLASRHTDEVIINTASLFFVRAEPVDYDALAGDAEWDKFLDETS